MIRRPPRSTQSRSSAASDVYKRQALFIDPPIMDTLQLTVCANELPYFWNTIQIDSAGIYTDTLAGLVGCDTIRSLALFIDPPIMDTLQLTVCANELPYFWNTIQIDSAGIYTDTLAGLTGCDTIRSLELFIDPPIMDTLQ